mmetsp:Transcript_11633/g.36128  ORF Transcript_11633/g.36128 Transcript_11633/m.36128 type:complete len:319 (-) Transcript_11633:10-966(-)
MGAEHDERPQLGRHAGDARDRPRVGIQLLLGALPVGCAFEHPHDGGRHAQRYRAPCGTPVAHDADALLHRRLHRVHRGAVRRRGLRRRAAEAGRHDRRRQPADAVRRPEPSVDQHRLPNIAVHLRVRGSLRHGAGARPVRCRLRRHRFWDAGLARAVEQPPAGAVVDRDQARRLDAHLRAHCLCAGDERVERLRDDRDHARARQPWRPGGVLVQRQRRPEADLHSARLRPGGVERPRAEPDRCLHRRAQVGVGREARPRPAPSHAGVVDVGARHHRRVNTRRSVLWLDGRPLLLRGFAALSRGTTPRAPQRTLRIFHL